MIIDVACFVFDTLVLSVAVESPRDASSVWYTSLPIEEASLPRSEILSPAGSTYSDNLPNSEVYLSSADSCVSPNLIEGYSTGAILKPGGGTFLVFVFVSSLSGVIYLQ